MILLLGGSGLLGSAIAEELLRAGIAFTKPSRCELDVTNPDHLKKYADAYRPEKIIMCAAYTAVDQAESESDKCHALNTKSIQNIVDLKIPVIHFSTDYVFGNKENEPITEDTERNPLSFYGQSKAEAEKILENSPAPWWNIRTSWLYGRNGKNFVDSILRKAKAGERLQVVDDQTGRPTSADDLAVWVVKYFVQDVPEPGHYHLQNEGEPVNWYSLAAYTCEVSGVEANILPIKSKDLNLAAVRPSWSVLKNTKIAPMPKWKESMNKYVDKWPYQKNSNTFGSCAR